MLAVGSNSMVIVGHLHNELAKKQSAIEMTQFWDKLADFCAGGGAGGDGAGGAPALAGGGAGRILGMDANMAMFNVLPEMRWA